MLDTFLLLKRPHNESWAAFCGRIGKRELKLEIWESFKTEVLSWASSRIPALREEP